MLETLADYLRKAYCEGLVSDVNGREAGWEDYWRGARGEKRHLEVEIFHIAREIRGGA